MSPTLVDTSVFARLLERNSSKGKLAEQVLRDAAAQRLVACAQVLTEFWVVATRPVSVIGYGLDSKLADSCVSDIVKLCEFLPDSPDVFDRWRSLVVAHQVLGKQAHDARLVALLQTYGGNRVLTFNPRDFARYPSIEVVIPSA